MLQGSSALSEFLTSLSKSANTLALCQSKATLPKSAFALSSSDVLKIAMLNLAL